MLLTADEDGTRPLADLEEDAGGTRARHVERRGAAAGRALSTGAALARTVAHQLAAVDTLLQHTTQHHGRRETGGWWGGEGGDTGDTRHWRH